MLLVAVCVVAVLAACSGPAESAITELWPAPDEHPAATAVSEGNPLKPLIEALERGACEEVVSESSRLMTQIRERVAAEFHGSAPGREAGTGSALAASTMRRLLDDYVYADPPMLVLGDYRFRFPRWWSTGYADCLVGQGRYAEAADVYGLMLQEEVDAKALWRLALVYAWSGREVEAIGVLESWPANLTQPAQLSNVLERLHRGEAVPRWDPAHVGAPD